MNQVKIGRFLKELRKKKGLTQEQIAEKFHVSNRTISRWENGNNMPDLDVLMKYQIITKLTYGKLFCLIHEMFLKFVLG